MNFFRYFWLSCSGFKGYVALFKLPLRASLFYWSGVCAVLSTLFVINLIHWLNLSSPLIVKVSSSLPPFALTNGQASSSLPQPYFANTNSFPIILDLNDEIKTPQKMFPHEGLIIKRTQLQAWSDAAEFPIPPVPFKGLPNGEVSPKYVESMLSATKVVAVFFFIPIFTLFFLFLGMMQAMLFTMFAGLMERSMQPSFSFSQLFNISLFALTPSTLLLSGLWSAEITKVSYSIVYFGCYCFFVVMASGFCRSALRPPGSQLDSNPEEDDDDNNEAL